MTVSPVSCRFLGLLRSFHVNRRESVVPESHHGISSFFRNTIIPVAAHAFFLDTPIIVVARASRTCSWLNLEIILSPLLLRQYFYAVCDETNQQPQKYSRGTSAVNHYSLARVVGTFSPLVHTPDRTGTCKQLHNTAVNY